MGSKDYVTLANRLRVSKEAIEIAHKRDLIDLHIDTFIPMRLWGYDIRKRHGKGLLRGRFAGHLDVPRMVDGGLTGAMWSVTTNPFRFGKSRWKTVQNNFLELRKKLMQTDVIDIVTTVSQYRDTVSQGRHAAMLAIQGGNALDASGKDIPDPDLLRVTLVHLTNSNVGMSSSPAKILRKQGLTKDGRKLVEKLNHHKIFVDLAHISQAGFWKALEVHDDSQPVLVTHTGVSGVTPHWRNLSDKQIRAVAATGGVIGIMFATMFLKRKGPKDCSMIVDHVEHVINVGGEDCAAIGSDFDGAIVPPKDIRSADAYPRLIQKMLDRRWSHERIQKVLGGNFLRTWQQLRG